jgi:hypothetical protein
VRVRWKSKVSCWFLMKRVLWFLYFYLFFRCSGLCDTTYKYTKIGAEKYVYILKICVCVCVRERVCVCLCVCARARACVCRNQFHVTRWKIEGKPIDGIRAKETIPYVCLHHQSVLARNRHTRAAACHKELEQN